MSKFYYIPNEEEQMLNIYTRDGTLLESKPLSKLTETEAFGVVCHALGEGLSLKDVTSNPDRISYSKFMILVNKSPIYQEMYRVAEKNRLRSLKEKVVHLLAKDDKDEKAVKRVESAVKALSSIKEEDKTTTEYINIDWNTYASNSSDAPPDASQIIPTKNRSWN